jgi:hypothetical protein
VPVAIEMPYFLPHIDHMHRLATALIVLLLAVPAEAGRYQDADGKWWKTIDPPAKWMTAPYSGQLHLQVLPPDELKNICDVVVGRSEPLGCSIVNPWHCTIYISNRLPSLFQGALLQHEEAHCRGWPADHPVD